MTDRITLPTGRKEGRKKDRQEAKIRRTDRIRLLSGSTDRK